MLKVKYSTTYSAKMARLRRLPKLYKESLDAMVKRDAKNTILEFQKGLLKRNFGLEPLKPETIDRKRRKGSEKPTNPLYDLGLSDPRTYINMFLIARIKNGWRVRPSSAMHHSKKIKLKDLFQVHEYGAIIKHKNGTLVRIPPRPALYLAYRRWLIKRRQFEPAGEVRRAITEYINTGRQSLLQRISKKKLQGLYGDIKEI